MKGKLPKKGALALPAPRDGDAGAAEEQVLGALGLREAASLLLVSAGELAIAAAAVLGGICAPNPRIETVLGPRSLRPLDVMFEAESEGIGDAFDFLISELGELQRRLVRSMERYDPDTIHLITQGLKGKQWGTRALGTFAGETIRNHLSVLRPDSGTDGFTLDEDTAADPVGIRAEAVTHPRFLLVDFPPQAWIAQVDACHQRQALLVLRAGLTPDRERNLPAMTKSLLALMGGIRSGAGDSRGTDNPIAVRALLAMDRDDRIGAAGAGTFGRILLVPSSSALEQPPPDGAPLFPEAYHEVAGKLIGERRREQIPVVRFDLPDNRARFAAELRDFEKECRLAEDGSGLAAAGLPAALFRLFSLLLKTGKFGDIPEERLVAAAFGLSRRALAGHAAAQRKLVVASQVEDGIGRAYRIVEKLEASAAEGVPRLSARMIIRKFDKQKTASFQPAFDALVGAGVLDLEGNFYGLGEVCASESEDRLRAWLAAFHEST